MITAEQLARMYYEARGAARKLYCSEMVKHQFVNEYLNNAMYIRPRDLNQFMGMPVEVSPMLHYGEWFIINGHDRIIASSPGLNAGKAMAILEASRPLTYPPHFMKTKL